MTGATSGAEAVYPSGVPARVLPGFLFILELVLLNL